MWCLSVAGFPQMQQTWAALSMLGLPIIGRYMAAIVHVLGDLAGRPRLRSLGLRLGGLLGVPRRSGIAPLGVDLLTLRVAQVAPAAQLDASASVALVVQVGHEVGPVLRVGLRAHLTFSASNTSKHRGHSYLPSCCSSTPSPRTWGVGTDPLEGEVIFPEENNFFLTLSLLGGVVGRCRVGTGTAPVLPQRFPSAFSWPHRSPQPPAASMTARHPGSGASSAASTGSAEAPAPSSWTGS